VLQWSKKGVREDFQFPNVKNQFEVKPAQSYGFDCIGSLLNVKFREIPKLADIME